MTLSAHASIASLPGRPGVPGTRYRIPGRPLYTTLQLGSREDAGSWKIASIVSKRKSEYKLASEERVEKGTGELNNVMGIVWYVVVVGVRMVSK